MKIVHISDTHGLHGHMLEEWLFEISEIECPDVIVHSGDFMQKSMNWESAIEFIDWYANLPFKNKILVPGNHDCFLQKLSENSQLRKEFTPSNLHLLIDEAVIIDDIKFYGSPYTPAFMNWCFMLDKTQQRVHWESIPQDTAVLITHGPAYGVLDQTGVASNAGHLGCPFLKKRIQELKLKAHLFGHIHGGYGKLDINGYSAFNGSSLSEGYQVTNRPHVFTI